MALLLVGCSGVYAQGQDSKKLRSFVEFGATVHTGDNTPLWQVSNLQGLGSLDHSTYVRGGVFYKDRWGKWEVEGGIDESGRPDYSRVFTYETTPLYLTIPLTLDLKIWSNNGNKMVVSAGPYVGFGMGGKYKVNGKEKSDLFSADADGETLYKKFDAGIQYGVGGIIRHFYIGVNGQLGLMPVNDGGMMDGCRNLFADLTIGYYF